MTSTSQRMTVGIALALVAWGVYLAVGSTGMFVQDSMMDPRKSAIVIVCMAMFLGLWWIVLKSRLAATSSNTLAPAAPEEPAAGEPAVAAPASATDASAKPAWSKPGLSSIGLGAAGGIFWALAIATWNAIPAWQTTTLGWLAAVGMMGSATAGIVALSDPRRRPGKWLGVLGLLVFLVALIGFVARMTPQ